MESKSALGKLFVPSTLDAKDELEEKLEKSWGSVQSLINGLSDKETHDILNTTVSSSALQHEEVSIGLLTAALLDPSSSAKRIRDLLLISRDGLQLVLSFTNQLILKKFRRLTDASKQQLLLLLREFIRSSINATDTLCLNLLRQIPGGDLSPKNLVFIEAMLDLLSDSRAWMEKQPHLIASVVYTYLRLVEDHLAPQCVALRQKEVVFLIGMLRDRFTDCMMIGRDLVRLLQNVARIPEFDRFWRDLLHNPTSLSPNFTGLLQLLQMRTSRRFLQLRLTPDMEEKIVFLTSQVRFGNQKRYQDWFQRQYLATPESQSLRCDLIRFIVGVIHPTNELLCSDVIPRWAVIGWLLTTCTSNVAAANAKLALFYDWLFYDPEKDNIMNVEPAILVMHHSMRPHPAVTATLLDFLCRVIPNFYPPLLDKVRQGIHNALRQILKKGVLPSLSPLFDNNRLDKELRGMLKENFSEFCDNPQTAPEAVKVLDDSPATYARYLPMPRENNVHDLDAPKVENHVTEPDFSDEDNEDVINGKVKLKDFKYKPVEEVKQTALEGVDKIRNETLKSYLRQLAEESDSCVLMENFVKALVEVDEEMDDQYSPLAMLICGVLEDQLTETLLPNQVNEETLAESLDKPLFVLFRNLSQSSSDDRENEILLNLISEMHQYYPSLGYRLLYFLKANSEENAKDPYSLYKDFNDHADRELKSALLADMECCQQDDQGLFCWLIPDLYKHFASCCVKNAELLRLMASSVDASQLNSLICSVIRGDVVMFRKDSFVPVLKTSLTWETWEQMCVWQLVSAHNIPVSYVAPLLSSLSVTRHPEAMTAMLSLFRHEKPSTELLKNIMSSSGRKGLEVSTMLLVQWCKEYEDVLSQSFSSLINLHVNLAKRKRGSNQTQKPPAGPSLDQVLGHLQSLCSAIKTSILNSEAVQQALQQASTTCSDSQRKKFKDLFAEVKPKNLPKSPVKKGRTNKRNHVSDSSESSSEEEEIKTKPAKKRRTNTVHSDSE
ncbi:unnamed protein product [Darwinula stevensoni]|uniref:SOSS complex subunit A homolog n=1 Tax=Darwinula stevensoni TaxID=69355 RepID=A0A7R9A2T2_9CRUS|nr:unnamed protein product [Darwinula stevensoni]CAG0880141.1 unnamed protein product [Darwinula stevensoni]